MKKCAALLALLAANSANTAVISSDALLALETTEINQTLTLDQFDATQGTLTSVDITQSGRGVSSATVENRAAQEQIFRFSSILDLIFSGPALSKLVAIPLFETRGFISIDSLAIRDLGRVDELAQRALSVDAANFGAFVGAGTFDLGCQSVVSNTTGGGGGNVFVAQSTQAGCGATVAHTFNASALQPLPPTAISEPGSMAPAGLGLFGVGRAASPSITLRFGANRT